jgi:hypothetical protein
VVTGVGLGLYLNAHKEVSWEAATLIEISACVAVFVASGLVPSRDAAYRDRVNAFFRKLATPIGAVAQTREKAGFQQAMTRLYAVALGVTGVLFVGMSIPSAGQMSGNMALLAGILCLVIAAVLVRKSNQSPASRYQPEEEREKASVRT